MKIETVSLEEHQIHLTAEATTELFNEYKIRAIKKISKEIKIPGFRPGKAPLDIVRRLSGEDVIEKEALELFLEKEYPNILTESGIKPAGPGILEKIHEIDPPKLSFIIPLEPEVQLGDYRAIRKDYLEPVIEDKEINDLIENLRKNQASAEPVDRAAKKGDLVYLKISSKAINEQEEKDDPGLIEDAPYQVVIAEDTGEDAWPFPGFSKALIGKTENEEFSLEHKYKKNTVYSRLAGKEVKFTVRIESIKQLVLPKLNDEFAQAMGEFETLEKLKEVVGNQILERKRITYNNEYTNEIIDMIVEQSEVKFSNYSLDEQIEQTIHTLEEDLSRKNLDLDTYIKTLSLTKEEFIEKDIRPVAIKRLKNSLVLEKIAENENIQIGTDELQEAVSQTLSNLEQSGYPKPKNKVEMNQLTNSVAYSTASRLINQRLLDLLKDVASGKLDNQDLTGAGAGTPEVKNEISSTKKKSAKKPSTKNAVTSTNEPVNNKENAHK